MPPSTINWILMIIVVWMFGCRELGSEHSRDSETTRDNDVGIETDTTNRDTASDSLESGDKDTVSDADTDSDTDTDIDSDADADTDSDSDTDADTDTDTDADSDTQTFVDTETDSSSEIDTLGDSDSDTHLSPPDECIYLSQYVLPEECIAEIRCNEDEALSVTCDESGDSAQCTCVNHLGEFPFEAAFPAVPDTCMHFTDLCKRISEVPDIEYTCPEEESFSKEASCSLSAYCTYKAVLPDGIFESIPERNFAYCDEDFSRMYCGCPLFENNFSLTDSTIEEQTCATAWDICNSKSPFIVEEPVSCVFEAESSSPASCYYMARCYQWGRIDGIELGVSEIFGVNCDAEGDQTWGCECYGTELDVSSFSSANSDVCKAAFDTCKQMVDLRQHIDLDNIGRPVIIQETDAGVDDADAGR